MTNIAANPNTESTAAVADLYVTAELIAKPGSADILRDLMLPITAKARTEPGCKHCAMLEVQSEPGHFLTYEIWTERAALDAHMNKPHIKALRSKIHDLLAQPFTPIFRFYNAVSPG